MEWTDKWQLRCPKCDFTVSLEEVGGTRIGASKGKRTLMKCPQCQKLRWAHVEPQPQVTDSPNG
jgi:endogenous inhibitor of DNA gyrase (YacG/DUF329 family)